MAFDKAGNVLLAGMVQNPNLPASPDALLRAPCVSPNQPYRFQYFELRTIAGKLLHATYHPAGASATGIHGFEDLGRPFLLLYNSSAYNTPVVVRIHAARPATPQISCLVNPASRQSLNYLAPGDLAVISGALLGPRDTVQAAMTSEGKLPLELAGIQVLLGARPMPLVSVQHGSIIFHVPPETSQGGSVPLEVRSGGTFLAGRNVNVLSGQGQFVVFTTDGSGFGQAAAVNQDGSLNSEMAASEDSVVAIFGVGPTPTRVRLSYSETAIEYAGPAPGLIPGVKQVNLRILKSPYSWAKGDSLEQLVIEPAAAGAPRVYLRCVRRGS
jgi:uncharacterized protein (TIGR03437 family)